MVTRGGERVQVRGVQRGRTRARALLTALLVVAVAVVLWRFRSQVAGVFAALMSGSLVPMIGAAAFGAGRIVLHALSYTRSFRIVGADVGLRFTIPAWFKAVFMNTVLPSGGTSGLAAVVDAARGRGVPVGSATSAALFTQTCYYSAMFLVVVVGMAILGASGMLEARDVVFSLLMGFAALGFLSLLIFGHLTPGTLQRLMRRAERLVVRICSVLRLRAPAPWADRVVRSFSDAASRIVGRPKQALAAAAVMVVAMALDMLAFICAGLAFGMGWLPALMGAYATALVFNSFSPTPGGVGVVEGLSAAVLAGYGYPLALALSAVLSYRALMYWIPFAIGGVAMRLTSAFASGKQEDKADAATSDSVGEKDGAAAGSVGKAAARVLIRWTSPRSLVGAGGAALAAVWEMVAAALPRDSGLLEMLSTYVPSALVPLDPTIVIATAYLVLLCVPGLVVQDMGCWILSVASLSLLGAVSALAGNGTSAELVVLIALATLVVLHAGFMRHNFLRRVDRLGWVLLFGLGVAALYAGLGMVFLRTSLPGNVDVPHAALIGLWSLVANPGPDVVGTLGRAAWFSHSARAVSATLLAASVFVAALVVVSRWRRSRSPRSRAMRAYNKNETRVAQQVARAEREAARKERSQRK